MLKRCVWLAVATLFFAFQVFVTSATAAELDQATRTIPLNDKGDTTVLSIKDIAEGKRLFQYACAECHMGGITKTDPNVGLDPESLALATPPRNNVASMVDYLKNPTTYDGETEISEVHPSLKSADVFPEMRNLNEDDLAVISGYILLQPNVVGEQWGGGKYNR